MSRKFSCHLNLISITGTVHEDQYTFMIISHSPFLRMKTGSDKICRENQNTHFIHSVFFIENLTVYKIMWKNTVEPDRPQMTIWRMRFACWMTKATKTHL
jgi:hypothetical protein